MGWSLYPVAALAALGLLLDISFTLGALCWWAITLLHEAGHCWVAQKHRCHVLNIQLHLFHGLCIHEDVSSDYIHGLIAWGGCLFQAIVGIPCLFILYVFGDYLPWYLATPVIMFGPMSLLIGVVNLIPARGLDGEYCWRVISPWLQQRKQKVGKRKSHLKSVK